MTTLAATPNRSAPSAPPVRRRSHLARFRHFARGYEGRYGVGIALLLATTALSLGIPRLLGEAVRSMEGGAGAATIVRYAGGIVALALAGAVVRTGSRLLILGASRRIAHDVRNVFFRHLARLSPGYYDANRTGDIMSRGVNDMQLLRSVYGPGVLNFLNTIVVFVGVLFLLGRIDVPLTLASLALYPVMFLGVNRLSRGVYSRSRAVQEQLAAIGNKSQESFSGIVQIKTHVQEARQIAEFEGACGELRTRNVSMAAFRGAMISLIGIVGGAGTLLVLYLGGRLVISGRIDLGAFVEFNAYLALLAWPTIAFGWIVNTFQRGIGAMERIDEVLAIEPDVPSPLDLPDRGEDETRGTPLVASSRSALTLRDLSFTYPTGDVAALQGVTLDVEQGSKVGLVGPVGCGKSTIAALLARLYPAPAGAIAIGGTPIEEISPADLRRRLVVVPQDAFLFSRSLRENVAFGRPGASDDEIERAVETAGLARDLGQFPQGLDTVVGERGFTLSGGQRQRVTIARALLTRPEILVLDDSLSSVDSKTESAILGELASRHASLTTLFITHRLSAVADADRIFVLDRGEVAESGRYDELAASGGLFARLLDREKLENRMESS